MKFKTLRLFLVSLLASSLTSFADEKAPFFGNWEPRPALRSFWKPVKESWWITGQGTKSPHIARHCEEYARLHTPEELVPEIVMDLKANPSEVRWFVYLYVMMQWPQKRVLHALGPFDRSKDGEIRHIENEFVADIE